MKSSRMLGLARGKECVAYAITLLAERGEQGISGKELEALVDAHCGGTHTSNKVVLIRARQRGVIFGKQGTEPEHGQFARYFDTQEHCEAFPVLPRRSRKEVTEANRERRLQLRAERLAARAAADAMKPKDRMIVKKAPKPPKKALIPTGEPIITAETKVTIAPPLRDPRFYVDPTHRGEFCSETPAQRSAGMREWAAKLGREARC